MQRAGSKREGDGVVDRSTAGVRRALVRQQKRVADGRNRLGGEGEREFLLWNGATPKAEGTDCA